MMQVMGDDAVPVSNLQPDDASLHQNVSSSTTYAGWALRTTTQNYFNPTGAGETQCPSPYEHWEGTGDASGADFWVKVHIVSGSLNWNSGGVKDTWISRGTVVGSIVQSSVGVNTCVVQVQIATDSSGSNITDDVTYNLRAERT